MTQNPKRRTGTITFGTTVYDLILAERADAYQSNYEAVWPSLGDVPGVDKIADTLTRTWYMTNWDGGEGFEEWVPGQNTYHTSSDVIPKPVANASNGDLVLAPYSEKTVDSAAATFTYGARLCLARGNLYAAHSNAALYVWDLANNHWDTPGTATGSGAAEAASMCDAGDGSKVYIAYRDNSIRSVIPGGANAEHYAAGTWGTAPILESYDSRLFALDGDDLYEITAANTRVQVGETYSPPTATNAYLTGATRQTYNRLCATDTGLAWYTVADNGQVHIWDYNVPDDLDSRIGKLPVEGCYPYGIMWSNGYIFVAFRYASRHDYAGPAYIYYQRGGLRGIAGPVRQPSTSANKAMRLCGTIGDDIYFIYNGYLWAYNISAGAIICKAKSQTSNTDAIWDGATWGKDIFVCNVDNGGKVERFDTDAYTTAASAYLETGRFDFGYEGILKTLLEVRVTHAPLPANTKVTMAVSADGGTYTTLTGDDETDGATTFRWAASTYLTSITGYEFELKIGLNTTASANTPTIRSITARAASAQKRRSFTLLLDSGTFVGGQQGKSPRAADTLADLRAIAGSAGIVRFTNPWDGEAWDASTTHDCVVAEVVTTQVEPDEPPVVALTMWEFTYV